MKLCRFGPPGQERPGLIDTDGNLRDLGSIVPDITIAALPPATTADPASLPIVPGNPRFGVPIHGIGKIVAIGLNYRDHAIESNLPIPTEPVMFMKALSSLTGPNDPVMLPQDSVHSDWEIELGVIIGKTCRYVSESTALAHIAGYVLVNDVSERFNQKQRGTQWSKGKGHDTFCPVGPYLVTPDEIGDPQNLNMTLDLNGARMQTGNTGPMIFPVSELIAYASRFVTLLPGDLLITGTPPGVGEGKKPTPIFLKPGDQMTLWMEKLGRQSQSVIAWQEQPA
jgi:2-keto-4-pentenoate hydratase/2-oxohepta-3-ene-1,7-dioic acid hydratase in catechol pathway